MDGSRMIGLLAAAAVALAGCGAGGSEDKAGPVDAPTVLTMADVASTLNTFPAVTYFTDHVAELSGGKLKIDVKLEWTNFAPDAEQQIVRDVAAGKADTARIGTRAFDRLGDTAFQALTAPMLIDNYPLQTAVINSQMPTEMLGSLKPLGVTGLGVLAGQLRKPVAVTKPLLSPADWHGLTVQTRASDGEVATVHALGAKTTEVVGPTLDRQLSSHQIDGLPLDLAQYDQQNKALLTPYVTANVNLWPQTIALIVNSDRLAKLSKQQRAWLETAARDAVAHSTQIADEDDSLMRKLCERSARFADASPQDLAALGTTLEPAYAELERDPATKKYLDEIRKLKAATLPGSPLTIPAGCTGAAPVRPGVDADPKATSALNGIYRYTLTLDDVKKWFTPRGEPLPGDLENYPNTYTLTLRDGKWTSRESAEPEGGAGTYAVRGDLFTWWWDDGTEGTFAITVDAKRSLHFTPSPGAFDPDGSSGGDFIMTAKPWIKIA